MLHIDLCDGIHRPGRFIKYYNPRLTNKDLGECHAVPLPLRELPGHPFQDFPAFFIGKSSHLERYKCLSHCEFFWELQPDCIGEVVKYRAVGEKVVLLMEETDIRGRPAALLNAGFGHIDPFFANPDIHLSTGRLDKTGNNSRESGL